MAQKVCHSFSTSQDAVELTLAVITKSRCGVKTRTRLSVRSPPPFSNFIGTLCRILTCLPNACLMLSPMSPLFESLLPLMMISTTNPSSLTTAPHIPSLMPCSLKPGSGRVHTHCGGEMQQAPNSSFLGLHACASPDCCVTSPQYRHFGAAPNPLLQLSLSLCPVKLKTNDQSQRLISETLKNCTKRQLWDQGCGRLPWCRHRSGSGQLVPKR